MQIKKASHCLFSGCVGVMLIMSASMAWADPALEYKLDVAEDGQTYEVWMKPSATPEPDISLTGQLTIKVPHAAKFQVTGVQSPIEGADWMEASRVDAPTEDPESDYISFSFMGAQGGGAGSFQWQEGEEKLVMLFSNEGGCVNGVSIMPNDDLFNVEKNSENTNPGNQFTNLGWGAVGENNFKGVYGEVPACK